MELDVPNTKSHFIVISDVSYMCDCSSKCLQFKRFFGEVIQPECIVISMW